jgi:hypothetical protein
VSFMRRLIHAFTRDIRERPFLTLLAFVGFVAAVLFALFYLPFLIGVTTHNP